MGILCYFYMFEWMIFHASTYDVMLFHKRHRNVLDMNMEYGLTEIDCEALILTHMFSPSQVFTLMYDNVNTMWL